MKGLYVYCVYNTTAGELKTLKQIEEVHPNTVKLTDGDTCPKSLLREVDEWIRIEDCEPECEVIALGYQSEMLMGYIYGNTCESGDAILEEVTHWKPLPFTPKQLKNIFNK